LASFTAKKVDALNTTYPLVTRKGWYTGLLKASLRKPEVHVTT